MQALRSATRRTRFAPLLAGAILFPLSWLAVSCNEAGTAGESEQAPQHQAANSPDAARKPRPEQATARGNEPAASLRFVAYNVENWLVTDRYIDDKQVKNAPKPESEKSACVKILASASPDVVGLCEIGSREDAADLQQRLKAAGLDLPHLHHAGGADEVRHLALLSRFPLTPNDPGPLQYRLDGIEYGMQRGILDASILVSNRPFRFLGVHLKSKREVEEGSQEQMRRNEAHLLRKHVDKLLAADSEARLVVYGDFNDTRGSSAIRAVQGPYHSPVFLTALPLSDTQGLRWTHHWSFQDVYSRFDYIMVSQPLKRDVDFKASRILDHPDWDKASDHRAVLAIFR